MDHKTQIMNVIMRHPGCTRAFIQKTSGFKYSSSVTHRIIELLNLGFIRRESEIISGKKSQWKYFIADGAEKMDGAIKSFLTDSPDSCIKEIADATGIPFEIIKGRMRLLMNEGHVSREYNAHKKHWKYSWIEAVPFGMSRQRYMFETLLRSARS